MQAQEQRALLNIVIHAAMADGHKAEAEREAIRGVAESLSGSPDGQALAGVYQDVLLKRVSLQQAAAALTDPAHRQLAYEMAVCVCDADGQQSGAEQRFLADLGGVLGLQVASGAGSSAAAAGAAAVAATALAATSPLADTVRTADAIAQRGSQPLDQSEPALAPEASATPGPELDKTILNYAILTGALELLPQSWASVAIIPLQVKMVYRIGKAHGVELDQGHIKEFLATVGVGLTSQYLEQFGRKLLGGLLGKAAGRTLGGLAGTATGMAFSFATTYALGHLAKRYYGGGRVMGTDLLRQTYQELLGPAKSLQQQYLPAMRQQAAGLDAGKVLAMIRG